MPPCRGCVTPTTLLASSARPLQWTSVLSAFVGAGRFGYRRFPLSGVTAIVTYSRTPLAPVRALIVGLHQPSTSLPGSASYSLPAPLPSRDPYYFHHTYTFDASTPSIENGPAPLQTEHFFRDHAHALQLRPATAHFTYTSNSPWRGHPNLTSTTPAPIDSTQSRAPLRHSAHHCPIPHRPGTPTSLTSHLRQNRTTNWHTLLRPATCAFPRHLPLHLPRHLLRTGTPGSSLIMHQ